MCIAQLWVTMFQPLQSLISPEFEIDLNKNKSNPYVHQYLYKDNNKRKTVHWENNISTSKIYLVLAIIVAIFFNFFLAESIPISLLQSCISVIGTIAAVFAVMSLTAAKMNDVEEAKRCKYVSCILSLSGIIVTTSIVISIIVYTQL
ncbi:hypothetical protein A3Q56_04842 [Intoshia linei]|uniref:Uncharacterized protein n=1 Tax=Intoshia linei TaxID=1819745 RepID=A0A177AZY7_9BILA|nr:hypothetical protein A3Q56_04842 [Intoshia linei]